MKIYKHKEGNKFIKMSISYSKGGMNYFNGQINARGIYIYIQAVEREERNGYTSESFSMLGGPKDGKILLLELKRANQKKLDVFGDILQDKQEDLFDIYGNQDIMNIKNVFAQ